MVSHLATWLSDDKLCLALLAQDANLLRMSTVQEIQAAVPKLSREELVKLKDWLDDYFEDQLELTDEVKAKLDASRAEIAAGQYKTHRPTD